MYSIPAIQNIAIVSELTRLDVDDRPFRRAVLRGDMVRVHRGAYMAAEVWHDLSKTERYRHQVIAAALASRSHPTLSHRSAPTVWGIPLLGPPPRVVDVLATVSAGTRSEGSFRRHATPFPETDVDVVDGVAVTGFERTLVDLASTSSFASGVVALDWALAPARGRNPKPVITAADLHAQADRLQLARGRRRFERAVEFADGRSGSPGESLSRSLIFELGFPSPVLQQRFDDRRGFVGFVDFWWPGHNLIGEFDGLAKYRALEFTKGRPAQDIVVDEKRREDRLRALGHRVTRWTWAETQVPHMLFQQLRDAGLPSWRRAV